MEAIDCQKIENLKTEELVTTSDVSAGVMFSDMECTLIGGGHEKLHTWELYEQACHKVSELIDLILSFNNYFVLVSSCHHDAKERVARKYNIIFNYLSEKNRHKILFFISDVDLKYGKGTIEQYDDIKVELIGEKVECVDKVLKKLKEEGINISNIVGIGDDEKDVDMLFRIQELGGKVATIAEKEMYLTSLFHFPQIDENTYSSVIAEIAEKEYEIDRNILISKSLKAHNRGNVLKNIAQSSELKTIQEKTDKRKRELLQLYESREIDSDYLQKCLYNAELASRYYRRYVEFEKENQLGDGEKILERISSISEYHTNKALSSGDYLLELPKIRKLLISTTKTTKLQ